MKIKFLSANAIKIIAMALMLIDHIGYFIFPQVFFLRCLGRISFPLFAYFIAEGCKYSKNKLKRFLIIFILGIIFQVVYVGFCYNFKTLDSINILLTFSLSILLIYCLDYVKKNLFVNNKKVVLYSLLLILMLAICGAISYFLDVEYEFAGIIAPLIISIPNLKDAKFSDKVKERVDNGDIRLIFTTISVLLLPFAVSDFGLWQLLGLFVIPILFCYNGKRGKWNIKYLFYVFYPLHFVVLYAISYLMYGL